jgi:hypothetical protein
MFFGLKSHEISKMNGGIAFRSISIHLPRFETLILNCSMRKIFTLLATVGLFSGIANAQTSCDCMVDIDSTFSVVPFSNQQAPEYRNDDASSPEILLPFDFSLYGTNFNSCYINNNGNISFDGPYMTFVAAGFPVNGYPMVSAYWADVDTRDSLSGLVYYKVLDNALIVRYHGVGRFPNLGDMLNDFQIIISDGTSNLVPSGNNIAFCYGDMQWATSGAVGFNGSAANIGANAGDGVSAMQIGMFSQEGDYFDGPYNETDGVDYLDYSHIFMSTNAANENQMPVNVSNYCDTIWGGAGDTLAFFYFDDISQEIDFDVIDSSGVLDPMDSIPGFVVYHGEAHAFDTWNRSGSDHTIGIRIPQNIADGVYPFTIIATDNAENPLSTVSHYVLQIGNGAPTSVSNVVRNNDVKAWIANGNLTFSGVEASEVQQIMVHNSQGQVILQTNKLLPSINTDMWASGVYVYTIRTAGQVYSGKVVR